MKKGVGRSSVISSVFVVDRLHAELSTGTAALVDLFGILDRIEDVGVAGRGLRIFDAAIEKTKSSAVTWRAVRPFGVSADLERVDRAVGRDGPALGSAGHDLAVGVIDGQALVEVLDDEASMSIEVCD